MSTKKISVNADLLRVPGTRTRKQRKNAGGSDENGKQAPVISLSSAYRDIATSARLKKKLQNRLNKSVQSISASYSRLGSARSSTGNSNAPVFDDEEEDDDVNPQNGNGNGVGGGPVVAEDEYSHSVRYLQQLKQQLHQQQQARLQQVSGASAVAPSASPYQYVSLEVPAELRAPAAAIVSSAAAPLPVLENESDVPWGVLKGGRKKTFREWKKDVMEQDEMRDGYTAPYFTPRPPTPPKTYGGGGVGVGGSSVGGVATAEGHHAASHALSAISAAKENMERNRSLGIVPGAGAGAGAFAMTKRNRDPAYTNPASLLLHSTYKNRGGSEGAQQQAIQRKNVQTFRRKYTVGKFDKLNKVSVLIKDRDTQKNILQIQRTLKKTPISDMRKYLRQHGLIKIGSVCPPDLLRKMFESAVLAGEITNMNKNTLLHNLMHLDKEKNQ